VAVVGSPGGRRIINSVLQVILNLIDFEMEIQAAVDARRFHHQWLPDQIGFESDAVSEETLARLRAMGHTARVGGNQGRTNCIGIDPLTSAVIGAADTRQTDAAAIAAVRPGG
jgi:gamma-glutamyltranspeptidase/glutathione hydrolase